MIRCAPFFWLSDYNTNKLHLLISKWHIMKKNELLNLLYVERQRLSEQNSHIGWSIWILIGCIITLSWMLLEHYETSSMKSDQFCWSQIDHPI